MGIVSDGGGEWIRSEGGEVKVHEDKGEDGICGSRKGRFERTRRVV
jgi:hypothetical protein